MAYGIMAYSIIMVYGIMAYSIIMVYGIMAYGSTPYAYRDDAGKKWPPHYKCTNDTLEMCM